MTSKPAFPSIDHELASQPRPRLNLRALKPREAMDDAVVEANSRQLGKQWGASTTLASESDPEKEATRSAIASLRLEIPAYLDHELTMAAAQARVTKAFLVMTALKKAGYRVDPSDLVPDRRKARASRM